MAKAEEIFSIEANILRSSDKAVKIEVEGEEIWIPKSQMFDVEELPETGNARVKMTAWIAKEKGLR